MLAKMQKYILFLARLQSQLNMKLPYSVLKATIASFQREITSQIFILPVLKSIHTFHFLNQIIFLLLFQLREMLISILSFFEFQLTPKIGCDPTFKLMSKGHYAYAETHVSMFVHKLGLIKPRQT